MSASAPFDSRYPTKPLKHVAQLRAEKVDAVPINGEYLGLEQLESWTGKLSEVELSRQPESGASIFHEGDVLFGKLRPYLAKGWVANRQGFCTTESLVLTPRDADARFVRYCLLTNEAISAIDGSTYGSQMPRADWDFIGLMRVPCPDKGQQTRIATFLDEQTARIDALIAEKEGLLLATRELFEAKLGTAVVEGVAGRGTLTCRAEKGYDAVRADWRLVPLKYIASASGGMTPSKDNPDYWCGDVPWVSPKDMKRFELGDSADHVTQLALEKTSLRLHPPFSVLVVVRGMILAHTFPVAINTVPVTINQDMKALRATDRVSVKYLAWMLRGLQPLMLSLTEESAHGTKALRTDQWSNQHVPLPSPEEQFELVSLFERWDEETGVLCAHLQEHIARLREYRSSLISAAVTGQLDIDTFQIDAEMEAA